MKWDATTWEVEGQNRGSRHGLWVREPQTRRLGLLKFPKIRFASEQEFETGEVGAEVLAAKVGRFLGIPVPEVETAVFGDRFGSLSWSFLDEGYTLREGVDLFSATKGDVRHELPKLERRWFGYDLVICDELAYLPFSKTGAELLFHFFSARHERGSFLITTNLEFARWTEVFGDAHMTGALIDRLTHRAHILVMNGESYRFRGSLQDASSSALDAIS